MNTLRTSLSPKLLEVNGIPRVPRTQLSFGGADNKGLHRSLWILASQFPVRSIHANGSESKTFMFFKITCPCTPSRLFYSCYHDYNIISSKDWSGSGYKYEYSTVIRSFQKSQYEDFVTSKKSLIKAMSLQELLYDILRVMLLSQPETD